MRIQKLLPLFALTISGYVFAANDGSDVPKCGGVTDKCMGADVTSTDAKTGKTVKGYQPNEHGRDQKGLWMDCVRPLAKGQTVPGVTGVSAKAARACMEAERKLHGKGAKGG